MHASIFCSLDCTTASSAAGHVLCETRMPLRPGLVTPLLRRGPLFHCSYSHPLLSFMNAHRCNHIRRPVPWPAVHSRALPNRALRCALPWQVIVSGLSSMPNGIAWNGGSLFIASLDPYKSCTVGRRSGVPSALPWPCGRWKMQPPHKESGPTPGGRAGEHVIPQAQRSRSCGLVGRGQGAAISELVLVCARTAAIPPGRRRCVCPRQEGRHPGRPEGGAG